MPFITATCAPKLRLRSKAGMTDSFRMTGMSAGMTLSSV